MPEIAPEEMYVFESREAVASSVVGGYYQILTALTDGNGKEIFTATQFIKLGEIAIPRTGKPLTLTFMWELHQPLYPDLAESRRNLRNFINIYRRIARLYEKHPKVRSDICLSGTLLYQLVRFYPDVVEDYRKLVKKNTVDLVATGFGHPLFPFISYEEIDYQIRTDKEFKNFVFGKQPQGIHIPEMAFSNNVIAPMMANDIRWGYFSRHALDTGYKNMPDINYNVPSRLVSPGGVINILIRDPDAVNIVLKKNERALDEFIQYLLKIQEKNDGTYVVVVANNGEFIGDGKFMDELFTKLQQINWIRFKTLKTCILPRPFSATGYSGDGITMLKESAPLSVFGRIPKLNAKSGMSLKMQERLY